MKIEHETDEVETLDAPQAEPDGEAPAETAAETDQPEEGGDEVVVSLGDEPDEEPEPEPETPVIRTIRKQNRDLVREKRALEREKRDLQSRLDAASSPAAVAEVLGEKPTLEACNFDGDEFAAKLTAWNDAKQQADERKRQADEQQQKAQADWKAKLDGYSSAKAALKVRDYEDAEEAAREALSVVQQGVIVNGADNPAAMVYALGKSPKKLAELAAIKDPVRFAFAVARLETQLKVTPRKTAPAPERVVRSAGAGTSLAGEHLERLRAEGHRTGDMTKYFAEKRKQTAKA